MNNKKNKTTYKKIKTNTKKIKTTILVLKKHEILRYFNIFTLNFD
jgi:hypothetical protein